MVICKKRLSHFIKKSFKLIIITKCLFIYLFITITIYSMINTDDTIKNELFRASTSTNKTFYVILEYTKIFHQQKYCQLSLNTRTIEKYKTNSLFRKIFETNYHQSRDLSNQNYNQLNKCKYDNCFFTCNKEHLKYSDALIFHDFDLYTEWLFSPIQYYKLFQTRRSQQLWIYWNDEPNLVNNAFDEFKFNWSISYYKQSQVSNCAYGCIKANNRSRYESRSYKLAQNELNLEYEVFVEMVLAEFKKRSNRALWFVSNCDSKYRLKFALKFSKIYSLNVIGPCNKYFQNEAISVSLLYIKNLFLRLSYYFFGQNKCNRNSKCEFDLLNNNKFYLAFESTNCTDYITEKFWRTLAMGLIPIVIQPPKDSYERVAPIDSYIHAQDFNYDPLKLANYLSQVSSDFNLYLKHVKWRFKYEALYKLKDLEEQRLCELCTKLNVKPNENTFYYDSISNWFNSKCVR